MATRPAARSNLRFFLLGLVLVVVFLVCLAIYLASERAWREAWAELYGRFPLSFAGKDRLWELHHWKTSRLYRWIYRSMIISGVGSFLWLLTLIGKGIMWWVKRRG